MENSSEGSPNVQNSNINPTYIIYIHTHKYKSLCDKVDFWFLGQCRYAKLGSCILIEFRLHFKMPRLS